MAAPLAGPGPPTDLNCLFANLSCLLLAVVFVTSLHVWRSNLSRNHPSVIKKRFGSALAASVFAPLYVWVYSKYSGQFQEAAGFWSYLGVRTDCLATAALLPLILTMIAYLGPLTGAVIDWKENDWKWDELLRGENFDSNLIVLRNFVMAPLCEEFVFRACMLPLLQPCWGFSCAVLVCPLFFGVAHIHHVIEKYRLTNDDHATIWVQTAFQLSYTSIFGAYSAFLFLRTGHLIGPVVAHSFCNLMGVPALHQVPAYSPPAKRYGVAAAYLVGLLLFVCLVFPLTRPSLFANTLYPSF